MQFNSKYVVGVVLAALAVIGVALLLMYSGTMPAPTNQQYREALISDIQSVVPLDAKACGLVPVSSVRKIKGVSIGFHILDSAYEVLLIN